MTKDKRFNWRFCLCCGIFIWFVINLLQGIFTEIHEDEAYYALFGEHLAWGYFGHPPMVGLMTFLSSIFFSGTLGVRFFTIIVSCLSLWVMWKIATYNSPIDSSQRTSSRGNDMPSEQKKPSEGMSFQHKAVGERESMPSDTNPDAIIGQPCPLCGKGHIIKGKTAYGCSEWRNGCGWRQVF